MTNDIYCACVNCGATFTKQQFLDATVNEKTNPCCNNPSFNITLDSAANEGPEFEFPTAPDIERIVTEKDGSVFVFSGGQLAWTLDAKNAYRMKMHLSVFPHVSTSNFNDGGFTIHRENIDERIMTWRCESKNGVTQGGFPSRDSAQDSADRSNKIAPEQRWIVKLESAYPDGR